MIQVNLIMYFLCVKSIFPFKNKVSSTQSVVFFQRFSLRVIAHIFTVIKTNDHLCRPHWKRVLPFWTNKPLVFFTNLSPNLQGLLDADTTRFWSDSAWLKTDNHYWFLLVHSMLRCKTKNFKHSFNVKTSENICCLKKS